MRLKITRFFAKSPSAFFAQLVASFPLNFMAQVRFPAMPKLSKISVDGVICTILSNESNNPGLNWHLAGKEGTIFWVTSGFLSASKKEIFSKRPDSLLTWAKSNNILLSHFDLGGRKVMFVTAWESPNLSIPNFMGQVLFLSLSLSTLRCRCIGKRWF